MHVRLELHCAGALLVAHNHLQPGAESREFRARYDRDGDGALDAAERARLVMALVDLTMLGVSLELHGRRLPLDTPRVTDARGLDDPASSGGELSVEVQVGLPLDYTEREQRLVLRARHKDPHYPVTVTLRLSPLLLAGAAVSDLSALRDRPLVLGRGDALALYLRRGGCMAEPAAP
jgi:hypothetical protein